MNNYELLRYIDQSFKKYTGQHLPTPDTQQDHLTWIHEKSSYSLLAHNTEIDPKFIYANLTALESLATHLMKSLNYTLDLVHQK